MFLLKNLLFFDFALLVEEDIDVLSVMLLLLEIISKLALLLCGVAFILLLALTFLFLLELEILILEEFMVLESLVVAELLGPMFGEP